MLRTYQTHQTERSTILNWNRLLLPIFFCFLFGNAIAQDSDVIKTGSAKESLQIAQDYYAKGALLKAKRQLKYTIKIKKDFAIAYRILGKLSLELEEFDESIEAFEASFDLDDKLSRAAFFECAEAYLQNNNVEIANYYYTKYKDMKDKRYANVKKESALELEYDNLLKIREQNILFASQLDTNTNIEVRNMGKAFNSKHDEYLPSITSDGEFLLFTRDLKKTNENILLSKYTNDGWSNANMIDGDLNTEFNEGMAKFEAHGNSFYFAGCKRSDDDRGCDIYKAVFENGRVTQIDGIEGRLNSFYWDSQPSVTCDGTKLFFTSTREGGFGGADIWMSRKDANGAWGVPDNLGQHINTPGDEEAPFIATDGKTLYFTSNGHPGLGNGDIFVSYYEDSAWSIPDNLGHPINSSAKELGFYVQGDNKTAYFSSARKMGEGGLDIYETSLPELFRPQAMVQLEGQVLDKITQEPIMADVTIGNDGKSWKVQTDEKGWFFHCLEGQKGYSFQVHKEGYAPLIEAVYLESQDNVSNQQIALQLQKDDLVVKAVPVVVKEDPKPEAPKEEPKDPFFGEERLTKTIVQIYFDFDSASIDEKNTKKLESLTRLINKYEDWNVEVVGFADNVGDENYNKELSQNRANKVVTYLSDKCSYVIQTDVKVVGKGATGTNADEASRKKSRRVDIVLTR